jgi:hypothetical protein
MSKVLATLKLVKANKDGNTVITLLSVGENMEALKKLQGLPVAVEITDPLRESGNVQVSSAAK